MYGAFDVVLYFVIIQLFWLLINLLLILSYMHPSLYGAFECFVHVLYYRPIAYLFEADHRQTI